MAAQLKQLSSTFHIPVLVVNQVADFFAGADANGGEALPIELVKHSSAARTGGIRDVWRLDAIICSPSFLSRFACRYLYHWSMLSSGRRVVPALGLTWANCVNTRIFLTRKNEFVHGQHKPVPQVAEGSLHVSAKLM